MEISKNGLSKLEAPYDCLYFTSRKLLPKPVCRLLPRDIVTNGN